MEAYLLATRLFIRQTCDIKIYRKQFENEPERYMLVEDYLVIFPNDNLNAQNGLIDVLSFNDALKVQMLLLIQVNIGLIFLQGELITFAKIYESLNFKLLIKKYPVKELLFHLYELQKSPGIVTFLQINSFKDLEFNEILLHKEPNSCLANYWEYITEYFFAATVIEKQCLLLEDCPKEIPLWLYRLCIVDKELLLNNLNDFVDNNKEHFPRRIMFGYEGFRDLKVACSTGNPVLKTENRRDRRRPIVYTTNTIVQPAPKTKKAKIARPVVVNTCEFCKRKEPCIECDTPCSSDDFTTCHESIGGGHWCKDALNILQKEKNRKKKEEIQALYCKNGDIVIGYRLNNMLFTCQGHVFDTRGAFLCCPTLPEIHSTSKDPVKCVSLRLYVYNDKSYRLGTVTKNMKVLTGDDVYKDFKMQVDSCILGLHTSVKKIKAKKDNVVTEYSFYGNALCMKIKVNDMETPFKKSSIRVFHVWKSKTGKFQEPVPEKETNYCISYGILENVEKYLYDSIEIEYTITNN